MFGCSDVYHWMGRSAKAVCLPDCGRTCLKAHNLDATTFWFRAPNFGDPAQRHRQFCASSSLTEGTRGRARWTLRLLDYEVVEHHLLHPLQELARLPEDIAQQF